MYVAAANTLLLRRRQHRSPLPCPPQHSQRSRLVGADAIDGPAGQDSVEELCVRPTDVLHGLWATEPDLEGDRRGGIRGGGVNFYLVVLINTKC